jgi:prolyl-tRNA synthetase
MKKFLKKKSDRFADWYTDVILKAELADYAPVKGCMIIRPYGYALWEKIQEFLNKLIKEHGVRNAYFPLFIPESYLKKEKEHVEGFSPHMAVVTIAGGEELKEKLVVRPTSETIMYEMYKKWAHSWRDLPILINQWNNVVRWEKRTYLFLRTSEFLWQEGHCAHAERDESLKTVMWALDAYQKTYNDLMSIYGIPGVKSESEKFAGADKTFTFEILMPDGKALQGCTSHDLGQNFAKAFDWSVQNKDGGNLYPWQNSWGLSTRSIGGLILVHGDDNGLVLPPKIAPIQVVIIPIYKEKNKSKIINYAQRIKEGLKDVQVELDLKEEETVGFKFNKWELKGIPLRIEIGEKETSDKTATLVRRDDHKKITADVSDLTSVIDTLLKKIQRELFEKHRKFTELNTYQVNHYDEFKRIMNSKRGFIRAFWCENNICENKIKEETKASTRCLPLDSSKENGKCVYCGKSAKHRWLFAQAY